MDRDQVINDQVLLAWLDESYSNVLEYSADRHRAYIQDEDSDDGARYISVALARQLLADGKLKIWRYGIDTEKNKPYHTYKTIAFVAAWKQKFGIEIGVRPVRPVRPVRLAISDGGVMA